MSRLKCWTESARYSSTVRYFDNWRHSEQNNARALRDEMADEQREGLAHAIVYPTKTKTKPTGLSKNNRRLGSFATFAANWDLATGVLAMLALLTVRIRPL